jgi:hypothetical protein
VRSSTLPAFERFDDELVPAEFALVPPVAAAFVGAVERFLDADVLLGDDDRFLDGPQVDMTSYTVPRGCHTEP